jgi:hypothetical protein
MPEYIYTQGTKILLSGSISLLLSWIITLIFNPDEPAFIFALIPCIFAILAAYSAATESDWNLFSRWGTNKVTVRSQYVGNTSAVSIWSVITVGFVGLDLFIWFLIQNRIQINILHTLSVLLTLIGGLLIIVGGFIAHREWQE